MPVEVIEEVIEIEWTKENIEQLIRDTFPEDPDVAVAVSICESNLNPNAVNPEAHEGCISSQGLMQIACIHYDGDPTDLQDVTLNLQIARRLYDEQGWSPWTCRTMI